MQEVDIRKTGLYREAEALFSSLRQPGTGQISDAAEVNVSPDGRHAAFAGVIVDTLEGAPPSRICTADLTSGHIKVLTLGPNTDRLPKYSPDGRSIAFLSDRHYAGDFQLFLLDLESGAARPAPRVEGWVEYLHWSPNGQRVLLGVAGHGADIAGVQGAVTSKPRTRQMPSWMPTVETGEEDYRWRRAWVYEIASNSVRKVSSGDSNIWEAVWCGNDALAAVVSSGPGEGSWYSARLHVMDIATGDTRQQYLPEDQLGWPAGSPSGTYLAIVEAICSDRWFVAGDLRLIEVLSGKVRHIDTRGVDVTHTEWRSDGQLLIAGHRGFETVIGLVEATSGTFMEVWSSWDRATGGIYTTVSGLNDAGDCVLIGESFVHAPEIAVIREGAYHTIKSFDVGYRDQIHVIAAIERVKWEAPDGLDIQGWLLKPQGDGPHPLVMNIHGGPVWHWRQTWLGRNSRGLSVLMLLEHGYAIFFPNPRGSSGRGQGFARRVLGDMGGADTQDYLSGVDHLVDEGVADSRRLGVIGLSYGGFMTSWLVTQDTRFSAAVSVAPVTNHVTQRLIGNLPQFVDLFLADKHTNPGGNYHHRSPIMHAEKVKTPTLNICGALDRCTPPEEAVQFHNALKEHGVKSVLVTYPEEGHGVRELPAAFDYTARVVAWFDDHLN